MCFIFLLLKKKMSKSSSPNRFILGPQKSRIPLRGLLPDSTPWLTSWDSVTRKQIDLRHQPRWMFDLIIDYLRGELSEKEVIKETCGGTLALKTFANEANIMLLYDLRDSLWLAYMSKQKWSGGLDLFSEKHDYFFLNISNWTAWSSQKTAQLVTMSTQSFSYTKLIDIDGVITPYDDSMYGKLVLFIDANGPCAVLFNSNAPNQPNLNYGNLNFAKQIGPLVPCHGKDYLLAFAF